jgi:hypothetical protein
MTTLCLCDLVETHADRVRRTLAAVQAARIAAPDAPLASSAAPTLPASWAAAQREVSRFRITHSGFETAA